MTTESTTDVTGAPPVRSSAWLNRDQRRIVKAIESGGRYEKVMDVVGATIGHHVYEYVKVERLIDIIKAMAKRSNDQAHLPGQ